MDTLQTAGQTGAPETFDSVNPATSEVIATFPVFGQAEVRAAARNRSGARIVAVTGSVGKTGTKEALRLALATCGATYASAGGLNNHWGAPLSLARLPPDGKKNRKNVRARPAYRSQFRHAGGGEGAGPCFLGPVPGNGGLAGLVW